MRERKGFTFNRDGKIYARLQFTDENGKKRDLWRKAENKIHAKEILKNLIREIDEQGVKSLEAAKVTFGQLAAIYEQTYLIPAEYVQGRKIAGVRSLKSAKSFIKTLKVHFGDCLLKNLSYGRIEQFKQSRLKTPVCKDKDRTIEKQRSIASVNRELALLRKILNFGCREKLLSENPFSLGQPLISAADEQKRERILSRADEQRLLEACKGKRKHLKAIIIFLIDTGCRFSEGIRLLRWNDINFHDSVIKIQAFNTKTLREREVAITKRLGIELLILWEQTNKDAKDLVFGVAHHVNRSFNSAKREAGLFDLRIHDLRHTHASRLDELGFSIVQIGQQLSHTQIQTTMRYVNRNRDGVKKVANALDAFNNTL